MLRKFINLLGHDMHSSSWVTLRYVTTAGTGFLLSVLFARLTSKEVYGSYQYIFSLVSIVSVFSLQGFVLASLKSVVGGDDKAVTRAVQFSFFTSLLGALILIGLGIFQLVQGENTLGWGILVAALLFPFFTAPSAWYTYYHGRKIFALVEQKALISTIAVFVLMVIGLSFHLPVAGLIALSMAGTAFFTWVYFFQARASYGRNGEGNIRLSFALSVTTQKFFLSLVENIPILFIGSVFGLVAVAEYQIAYLPLATLSGYLGGLIALRLPRFFEGEKLNLRALLFQSLLFGILLFIVLAVFLTFLFLPIYGGRYAEALGIGWMLAPLILLFPLKVHLTNYFSAGEKNKEVIFIYAVANIISTGLAVALRPILTFEQSIALLLYGIHGSATLLLVFAYMRKRMN